MPSRNTDTASDAVEIAHRYRRQSGSFTVVTGLVLTTLAVTATVVQREPTVQQIRPLTVQQPIVTANTLPLSVIVSADPGRPVVLDNPYIQARIAHDAGTQSLALNNTLVIDPFVPTLQPNPERPQVRQYDTNGKANGLLLDATVSTTVHRGPTYQPLRTRQVQQPQNVENTVIRSVVVVTPPAPTAGGYYPADRKRKKLIIDGKTYRVSPQEEAQLIQAHIDRLNDDKREAEKEVKSQQKLLRIAISTAPKKTEQKPAQVQRVETRIAEIMESLLIIEAKRREAREIKAMIERAIDEEESMALILSMGL